MNNSVFGRTMENVENHCIKHFIKLVTTGKKRNKLASDPNYHTTIHFSEKLLAIEMNKINVKMNQPVQLGPSILDIGKIAIYKYWYDYVKPKYGKKVKLCYMNTDRFIVHMKSEDIYADLAGVVKI